jgi:hypothetical protein
MGGNLQLLRWLVETHACPIVLKRDHKTGRMLSLQTSTNKSLIDLAMTGKPKLDILQYLIVNHNMSLQDSTNPKLAPRTLEALLRAGITLQGTREADMGEPPHEIHSVADDSVTMDDAVSVGTGSLHNESQNLPCVPVPSATCAMSNLWIAS